jgi:hypothetical protein
MAAPRRSSRSPASKASSTCRDSAGALRVIDVEGRAALLLDPGWSTGQGGPPRPTALVAVFRAAGRRFALPVQQARPGTEGTDLEARLADTPEGRSLIAAAPAAGAMPGDWLADPLLPLLLCDAGDARFALSVSEIATVLAPRQPAPAPGAGVPALRGVVAHRGEVLPVVDLDPRLAAPLGADALASAPMIRLALPRALAVPVRRILGLQMVPRRAVSPIAADALFAGRVVIDGASLPLCRAAALAAQVGTA